MTGHYAAWMPAMGSGTGTPRSLPVLLARSARRQDSPVRFRAVTIVLATVLLLAGCTRGGSVPTPPPGEDTADRAAAELAAGLGKKDVSTVEFAGANSAAVNDEVKALLAGMGPLTPSVQVGSVNVQGQTATAGVRFNWTFPGVSAP